MSRREVQFRFRSHRRRGAILIVALVVTATLTGLVLALGQEMRVEAEAAANRSAAADASQIERGAEQYVIGLLTDPDDLTIAPTDLSEDQFNGVQLGDGYFWIVRPDYDDETMPVFGLTDEQAKININAAGQNQWINLLQGDTDTMTAITSWKNALSTGSEDDTYYSSLSDPYTCKHNYYETVEELLMVRNITRQWLYGDGTAEPLGVRTGVATPPNATDIITDAQASRGMYDLLTVSSIEPTTDPNGNALVALTNRTNLTTLLTTNISASRATSILSHFTFGTRRGANPPRDIFDLYSRGIMTDQELDEIADYVKAPPSIVAPAAPAGSGLTAPPWYSPRVNVDTAAPAVLYTLQGLGGLASSDIDNLIAARDANPPQAGAIAWVADAIGKQKAVGLGQYITARSYQFSADIVAVSGNGRAFKHVRIVVDSSGVSSGDIAQVTYRRDLTDQGWPMDPQILASLRTGQPLDTTYTAGVSFNPNGGITR